ncbi:hypothetical protein DL96DRAFT_1825623 [Flagelloscypha sp. PMI_526]|nr:hypothetical protein DL96DRAFT_1825623 [Flagelloscypha sp. PMI_526]
MSPFPLDLWYEILGSVGAHKSLESCSLVNHGWYHIAQQHRFKHLALDAKTWKAKTCFLLDDGKREFRSRIRTLGIDLSSIDSRSFDRDAAGKFEDLYSLMGVIGQQLTTFRMEGPFYDDYGEQTPMNWENLSPYFRSQLFTQIFPFIKSLQLVEVVWVPLLQILDKAARLRSIYLSSDLDLGADDGDTDTHIAVAPGIEFDLTFGIFSFENLDVNNSFRTPYTCNFIPNLGFLDPFDTLKAHLKHLTFGRVMFDTVVVRKDIEPMPLAWFTRLETLTFFIASPQKQSDWLTWFNWVADSVEDVAKSFRELRVSIAVGNGTVTWDDLAIPSTELQFNLIAPKFPFSIDFVTSWTNGIEANERMFTFIRRLLLPWEESGKLNFWVNLEV